MRCPFIYSVLTGCQTNLLPPGFNLRTESPLIVVLVSGLSLLLAELITTNVRGIETDCRTCPEALARSKLLSKSNLVKVRIFLCVLLPAPAVMIVVYTLLLRIANFKGGTSIFGPLVFRTENNTVFPTTTRIHPSIGTNIVVIKMRPEERVAQTEVTSIQSTPIDQTNTLSSNHRRIVLTYMVIKIADVAKTISTILENKVVHYVYRISDQCVRMIKSNKSTGICSGSSGITGVGMLLILGNPRQCIYNRGIKSSKTAQRNSIPTCINLIEISPSFSKIIIVFESRILALDYCECQIACTYVDIFNTGTGT